ncbi:SDR family oxidoreductase [Flavobacterium sp. RHBU_24]|uniref:SDR family oxidoreductase n=1 Tax=Flavobacterium sp. RHBU_24 TaxID=3391185 RepID=UPI0039849C54
MEIKDYLPETVKGKAVLLTGGTTGIGRAIALLLAAQGADIVFFGHEAYHLADALADIKAVAKGKVFGFVADCGTEAGIGTIFKHVDEQLGRLDILVNNAAIGFGNVTDVSYAELQDVLNINLLSYLACCAGAIERMKKQGGGHIVNIGSLSAQVREATGSVYVATKAGIRAYSEALRKDVNKHGIKVSLIEPGAVDTDMQQQPADEKLKKVESLEMLEATDVAVAVIYCLTQPKRCDVIELKLRPHLQAI